MATAFKKAAKLVEADNIDLSGEIPSEQEEEEVAKVEEEVESSEAPEEEVDSE